MPSVGVTELLIDWTKGDKGALDRLMPLVYEELRKVARRHLSLEDPGHTLQGTAVVHEVYLRLIDQNRVQWRSRAHFFAVAAQMIRRILVDHARQRHADKRGGAATKLSLDESIGTPQYKDVDLVALDDALNDLAQLDAQQAQVIELRFFAGLTIAETSEVLGISPATVERNWVTAKAWLFDQLNRAGKDSGHRE
jgi:RNA polymerase sigma factor (TIGR02999 family)